MEMPMTTAAQTAMSGMNDANEVSSTSCDDAAGETAHSSAAAGSIASIRQSSIAKRRGFPPALLRPQKAPRTIVGWVMRVERVEPVAKLAVGENAAVKPQVVKRRTVFISAEDEVRREELTPSHSSFSD